MAQELTYQDGHAKCQGSGCPNLVYAHLAHLPHLCMDCAQPVIDRLAALRGRMERGEISSEEHNRLAAKVGTDDEEAPPAEDPPADEPPAGKGRNGNGATTAS
ncbi:MAG: hypothetical protein IVW53_15460 [Chloroflexi bacterium]|nr:hypothetical protein [Chloroflexota bacterium]